MMFSHSSSGIKLSNIDLIPDGWYPFKIVDAEEGRSKSDGYPQVIVKCQCLDPRYVEAKWVWHWVTFLPNERKGASIPLHFLKSIGEPFEGEFTVNAEDWKGKRFMGQVAINIYEGKTANRIKQVSPYRQEGAANEEVPF